ncbi:MAG TPA: amidohydrolase family protein [Pyrinomonadaceae bacterium]|jgi:imidazolonepropionase-like amidohydrolase|nr:amidohydrolase family protein [Pyrinomonadaceae bacterium]
MRFARNIFNCCVASVLLLFLCAATGHAEIIAIKAGKLIDPDTGATAVNQIIIVEDRAIKAIGGNLKIPAGATVIDLAKYTVLPGLFDAHSHLCFNVRAGQGQLDNTLSNPTAYRAIQGVANARAMLDAGFTTVRDVGNNGNYCDTSLRLAIDRDIVPGPTMINSGRIIAPFGGQFQIQPERPGLAQPEYFFADSKDELRKAIRENIHYGARVIKIVVDDQPYIYSVDDIKFVVEEARLAGLKVAAHCGTERGARNAAEAGVASIEHGIHMSDETLQLAKRNNVVLVGTEFTVKLSEYLGLPPAVAKAFHANYVDRLKRAYKIGVPMVYGSDAFFDVEENRGEQALSIIDSFVEAGVANKDLLRYMTTDAARLLGVDTRRGAIKVGLRADIIATQENPFDNILTLKKVSFVMKNGKVFRSPLR